MQIIPRIRAGLGWLTKMLLPKQTATLVDQTDMKPERIQPFSLIKAFATREEALAFVARATAYFYSQASHFGGRVSFHSIVRKVDAGWEAEIRANGARGLLERFEQGLEGEVA